MCKKTLFILISLFLPATAFAAPVSWDFNVGTNILQPLQSAWTALVKADHYQATGTTASIFPYASTTVLSATSLCLSTDCRTIWPSVGSSGLSTSSPISDSDVLVYSSSGAGSAYGAATTTLTISGPFVVPSNLRALGTSGAITYTGLSTTSQPASSNLLVSNGGAGVYGVGTTSASCSGTVSCTGFTVIGASPITITGSGGGSSGTVSTSSSEIAGQVPFWTSTAGTPALLSGGTQNFVWDNTNNRLGIGTSTPWGMVSIHHPSTASPSNIPIFVIASSTASATSTLLVVNNNGNVGIGTTSPPSLLTLSQNKADGNLGGSILSIVNSDDIGGSGANLEFSNSLPGVGTRNYNHISSQTIVGITPVLYTYIGGTAPGTFGTKTSLNSITSNAFYNTVQFSVSTTSNAASQMFQVSAANNAATGIRITSNNAGSGVDVSTLSTGTNENVTYNAKGSGTITFGNTSTGQFTFTRASNFSAGVQGGTAATSQLTVQGSNATGPTTAALTLRAAAGGGNPTMTFTIGGIGIGTTSPRSPLIIASSTVPQLTLANGSATDAPYVFRAMNGSLAIGTSSVTTFATSTSILTLDTTTASTTLQKLDVLGTATSTHNNGINLTAGCFSISNVCVGSGSSLTGSTGQVAYFSGTNTAIGTSTIFIDTASRTGISSSTPFAALSVGPLTGTPALAVKGASGQDISQFYDSGGTKRVYIDQFGQIIGGLFNFSNGSITTTAGGSNVLSLSSVFGGGQTAPILSIGQNGGGAFATFDKIGRLGLGTTTPQWPLMIASSTLPQLTLSDASLTNAPYNFRAIGNKLYISTSSPSTFATTSSPIVEFDSSTGSTTVTKLDKTGTATSTFAGGINLTSGCYAVSGTCVGSSGSTASSTIQIFSASTTPTTTYTKPAGLRYAIFKGWSAGAGGGSAKGSSSTRRQAGSGGGSGCYFEKLLPASAIGATETITVGGAGAAGVGATPTNGGAGGPTSFTYNSGGTTVSGTGGEGGAAANSISTPLAGGVGGTCTGGDININGGAGDYSTSNLGSTEGSYTWVSGSGASSPKGMGIGGHGSYAGVGATSPTGYGAGGPGGIENGATNADGIAGTGGILIVEEYY